MDKANFYTNIRRSLFGGRLSQKQVEGIEALLEAWNEYGDGDIRKLAYVLATVYHEVDGTMQPIREYGLGRNRTYGFKVKYSGRRYYNTDNIFYGRGFTQNTWYENYEKLGKVFNVDLINNPDLLITDIKLSARASVYAMMRGLYTGRRLSDYFNDKKTDFVNARWIINRTDKADKIAREAELFYNALLNGYGIQHDASL